MAYAETGNLFDENATVQRKAELVSTTLAVLKLDALQHLPTVLPRAFEDLRNPASLRSGLVKAEEDPGHRSYFDFLITDLRHYTDVSPRYVKFYVEDQDGTPAILNIFGVISKVRHLRAGHRLQVQGVPGWEDDPKEPGQKRLTVRNATFVPPQFAGTVMPVYGALKQKVGQVENEDVHGLINEVLADPEQVGVLKAEIEEMFGMAERDILDFAGLTETGSFQHFLARVHNPASPEVADGALVLCKRLSAFLVACRRQVQVDAATASPEAALLIDDGAVEAIIAAAPVTLTETQKRAIWDVIGDLRGELRGDRLISGDVGFGKTYAYLVPVIAARRAGYRCSVLFPNSLIAAEVFDTFRALAPELPASLILSGAKKKDLVMDANPVLFGTTAITSLIANNYPDWRPHVLVCDEQQKFSIAQREFLVGECTNLIEATATCIPRTAALIEHGSKDVSVLDMCPVQKSIKTELLTGRRGVTPKAMITELEERLQNKMMAHLFARGDKVMLLMPVVEKDEQLDDRASVEEGFAMWEARMPGRVVMLHGKMKQSEKTAAMERLKGGDFDLLVCSTVVEIGITIPGLRGVVVYEPDKYGVSTLHQLRGRLARLGGSGVFVMFSPKPLDGKTTERLNLLITYGYDQGHALAEADMMRRGFGELDAGSAQQWGKTQSPLFRNLKLMPQEFMWLSKRLDVNPVFDQGVRLIERAAEHPGMRPGGM